MRPTDMMAEQQASFRTLAAHRPQDGTGSDTQRALLPVLGTTPIAAPPRSSPLTGSGVPIHGITNVGVEALNTTISWVKKTLRSVRNVEYFKAALRLDLPPYPTHTKV